jgi:hypothetical protein
VIHLREAPVHARELAEEAVAAVAAAAVAAAGSLGRRRRLITASSDRVSLSIQKKKYSFCSAARNCQLPYVVQVVH